MKNLRKIAFEIATEMDLSTSDLLQDEVEELGSRLESVRQSISLLADIADARCNNEIECSQNIKDVKGNLNEIKAVSYIQIIVLYLKKYKYCFYSSIFRLLINLKNLNND